MVRELLPGAVSSDFRRTTGTQAREVCAAKRRTGTPTSRASCRLHASAMFWRAVRIAEAVLCDNNAMPPRFAFWTILIDDKPTAFRARDREELLPTFNQLRRTNPRIEMKWFTRAKLWDRPCQTQLAAGHPPRTRQKPGAEW